MWRDGGLSTAATPEFDFALSLRGARSLIVSASYRTDIPAFYASWFLGRLRAGFCRVANPYGGGSYEVSLMPGAADGFVLWTRNLRPLLSDLDAGRLGGPVTAQFKAAGYARGGR